MFFENSRCLQCGRQLGFDAMSMELLALDPFFPPDAQQAAADDAVPTKWQSLTTHGEVNDYRLCKNGLDFQVCNWLIPADSADTYCIACRMNEMIPSLRKTENLALWESMEISKHRLIYTLLRLGLPVVSRQDDAINGLAFAFLEDKRTNQAVSDQHVITGHADGLITVNLSEADSAFREAQKQQFSESYRTLLGHFRHESGHYYWDRLIANSPHIDEFRRIFGDETASYDLALQQYYSHPPERDTLNYITIYAQSHPLEDWAETWAHYLHMFDTLETASDFGLISQHGVDSPFDRVIREWAELSMMMNSLNRSMGLSDAYPFILTGPVQDKLRFIHDQMKPVLVPTQF